MRRTPLAPSTTDVVSAASRDMTCFSFYATKNITSGEGGALTTNDDRVGGPHRHHGAARHQPRRLEALRRPTGTGTGTSSRRATSTTCSTAGRARPVAVRQDRDVFIAADRRSRHASTRGLRDLAELRLPCERPWVRHAYHLYPVIVRTEMLTADRDTIMNAIQAENVGIGIHFRAVHLHPYYAETFGFRRGMCPQCGVLLRSDDFACRSTRR